MHGGPHAAVNTLRAQNLRVRAPNLAQLTEFHKLPPFTVDFSRLHKELKAYWTRNDLNNGTYADDVELQVGSRIELRAHETHVDIGFAYAHPSMEGKPRFTRPRYNYRLFLAVITVTQFNNTSVLPDGYIRWV